MASGTPPPHQTEKPSHYTYLKEFRVNQCPLFQQHKCTQHRPFTCFHWHFSNQRRRRPIRKRDGTFNYSADAYCSKYDETTGICSVGDDCPYIHRNTGDTERRYHLRYYKTGTCIHETDSRGNCVKNGPHCAFAHGSNDLRPPVYDIREQQTNDQQVAGPQENSNSNDAQQQRPESVNLAEKIVNEDPKWMDGNFVLANYKTDFCKRPPRLCRQGYACPQYHNPRDRRRNPKKWKYRRSIVIAGIEKSTPCPSVKQGDDWKEPSSCEKGDNCHFCHTRTEQQFHPEIYKSTKCHDMTQTGYCPRGPFCAFAHVEQEIRVVEVATDGDDLMAGGGAGDAPPTTDADELWNQPGSSALNEADLISRSFPSRLSPVSKPRSASFSSGAKTNPEFPPYSKAPGSERFSNSNIAADANAFGSMGDGSWTGGTTSSLDNFSPNLRSPSHSFSSSHRLNNLLHSNPPYFPGADVDPDLALAVGGDKPDWVTNNSSSSLFPMSDPVNIPGPLHVLTRNPLPSPPVFFPAAQPSSFPARTGNFPAAGNGNNGGVVSALEFERMQHKCKQWENSWNQAKAACDAWKKEAQEANERARASEERGAAIAERCKSLQQQCAHALEQLKPVATAKCDFLHQHCDQVDLKQFPLAKLKQLQDKYKADVETVETLIWELLWQPPQ